jgi:hypothetical protein
VSDPVGLFPGIPQPSKADWFFAFQVKVAMCLGRLDSLPFIEAIDRNWELRLFSNRLLVALSSKRCAVALLALYLSRISLATV